MRRLRPLRQAKGVRAVPAGGRVRGSTKGHAAKDLAPSPGHAPQQGGADDGDRRLQGAGECCTVLAPGCTGHARYGGGGERGQGEGSWSVGTGCWVRRATGRGNDQPAESTVAAAVLAWQLERGGAGGSRGCHIRLLQAGVCASGCGWSCAHVLCGRRRPANPQPPSPCLAAARLGLTHPPPSRPLPPLRSNPVLPAGADHCPGPGPGIQVSLRGGPARCGGRRRRRSG